MSGSRTTTRAEDRLDNVHPGDVLREDFLIGSDIALADVASATGLDVDKLQRIVDGRLSVDADTDLRLGRYLGMSEGFFLRLQNSYDLEEVRRSRGPEIARIVKRAA